MKKFILRCLLGCVYGYLITSEVIMYFLIMSESEFTQQALAKLDNTKPFYPLLMKISCTEIIKKLKVLKLMMAGYVRFFLK